MEATSNSLSPSLQIEQLIKQYKNFEAEKGKEINEFMTKFQIRFVENPAGQRPGEEAAAEKGSAGKPQQPAGSNAVLIGE